MLVILGESGSGKTTLQNYIIENTCYTKAVSTTTRPQRKNEVNGTDYFFVSEEEFYDRLNDNEFIEAATYNNWLYGLEKSQLKDEICFVATPHGLRRIKKYIKENNIDIDIYSVYLKVDRISRLIKLLQRDGEKNIDESYRRSVSDVGMFDGIEDEVDLVINNSEYRFDLWTLYNMIFQEG